MITTGKGGAGWQVENGELYLGSDDGAQLALQITRLLNQPWRMSQPSQAGRAFVRQHHDWRVAAQALEGVHLRLAQHPTAQDTLAPGIVLDRSAK